LSHKLEVGERRSLVSHYTLTNDQVAIFNQKFVNIGQDLLELKWKCIEASDSCCTLWHGRGECPGRFRLESGDTFLYLQIFMIRLKYMYNSVVKHILRC